VKIARFEDSNGNICYGIVDDGSSQTAELIAGGPFDEFRPTGRSVAIRRLLAPVDPPNVIAIGFNYRDHVKETGTAVPERPLIFLKATTSVVGPGKPIVLPTVAPDEVDYEAELAVVIGKRCRQIEPDQVEQFIAGYTCLNDVSARDCQFKDKQYARGKSFDTFCPLGPWLVTTDEIDPSDLAIRTIINGEVMQDSRTSNLIFPVPELVSYLSRQFTLLPGTVIATGTPPGVGFARKPPRFLRSQDEVVIEIEGIGQLRNPVA